MDHFLIVQWKAWHIWCITFHWITGEYFKQIWPNFGELWTKSHPKPAWNHTFWCFESIWNLKTLELQVKRKWNLAQICTTWTPFVSQKMRVSMNKRVRGRIQKTTKKCYKINKISILTLPNNSLQNAMRVRIFLLLSLTIGL